MTVFAYPGNSAGLAVDGNGLGLVGGLAIADFPASFNTNVTVNNPNAFYKNGLNNTFIGHAGYANTGNNNTFLGAFTGLSNTTGSSNTFVGNEAGRLNTTGGFNTFFGQNAGAANIVGQYCTFVGNGAGRSNLADDNSFFGVNAGQANTTGIGNVFFGEVAGNANVTGNFNSYIGLFAGRYVTQGGNNTIVGANNSDTSHTTSSSNTFIGANLTGYGNVTATVIISDGVNSKNLTMDASSARFNRPVRPPQYAVASLPSAATSGLGAIAYATNGRKAAEGAAAGTGVPVFSDSTNWLCFYNNLIVTA